ncbi:XdhC family protein [Xanthobacter flavus]|uniref:XdhC family protein n=1 Tax=Xanthobacter flavus TaxID=281 RepID=UPI001AE20ADC|nr:XdhC family protein [Xanthobacter flavus]MBP2151921.1 xanthine dehydrogenase accessory factor [Xanthobacter flavus]
MRLDLLAALNAERAARRAAVVVTELATGAQRLATAATLATDPLGAEIAAALAARRSGKAAEGSVFLAVDAPPPRMLVIGAVHISQALAPMARLAGYDLTILDPRTAFATPERFPDVPVIAEWPDEALPAYALDPFTALVALTHDPKIDEPAIAAALRAECFYVGALGSRRTHAKRVERLAAAGLSQQALARIHAPIGMDIGASSPAEIAVAVLAEVIRALRTGSSATAGAAA